MNKVILLGNLTNDFKDFGKVAKSSIAVKKKYGQGDYFIDLLVFGDLKELCLKLHKGQTVLIEGEWQINFQNQVKYQVCAIESIQLIKNERTNENEKQEESKDDLPF